VGFLPSPKLALCSRRLPVEYVPDEDELLESESLEIVGEDSEDASLRTETIPIRILTEFSVFNIETGQLVTLRSLLVPRDSPQLSSYCAVGYVLPVTENAVDDVDTILDPDLEDCQYLRLSTILFMDVFDFNEKHKFLDRYGLWVLIGVVSPDGMSS